MKSTKRKSHTSCDFFFLVGDGGFEPPKASPADLQSVPFGHSGNPPNIWVFNWSWWTDSNPRPADYKSAALPAELHQHLTSEPYYTRAFPQCQQESLSGNRKFIALKLYSFHKGTMQNNERGGSHMTLSQLSVQYDASAALVAGRLA